MGSGIGARSLGSPARYSKDCAVNVRPPPIRGIVRNCPSAVPGNENGSVCTTGIPFADPVSIPLTVNGIEILNSSGASSGNTIDPAENMNWPLAVNPSHRWVGVARFLGSPNTTVIVPNPP
jgi:hypothetical protein